MSESVVTHLIGRGLEEKELWWKEAKKRSRAWRVFPGVDLSAFCVKGSCHFHSVLVHSRAVGPPDLMQSPLWATPGFACPGRRPTEILWKVA